MTRAYWHQQTQGSKRSALRGSARMLDTANLFGIKGSSGDGGTIF